MILIVLVVLAFLVVALAVANSLRVPVVVDERPGTSLRPPGRELSILTWNIGYAGLGKASDFIADGGKRVRAARRTEVEANLSGIRGTLARLNADVVLVQEAAEGGFMTRGIDVIGGVRAALAGYRSAFSPDVSTRLLPRGLSLSHGPATFTRLEAAPTEIVLLPEEPDRLGGVLPRRYHLQRTRLSVDGRPLVIYNVHLSAFDERAETRRKQVDAVFRAAVADYDAGAAVILGGDWNLLLAKTDFPHTTEARHLTWVHPFPTEAIPTGWRIAADATSPTVRTNERPYRPGENYTGVIDGFIVSPNVDVLGVKTHELEFEHADHQPILARFGRKQ